MALTYAKLIDALPNCNNPSDRDARFPSPDADQKVYVKSLNAIQQYLSGTWTTIFLGTGTAGSYLFSGTGSPEGAVTAPVSSVYFQTDGTNGRTLWVKRTGTGNTGWALMATSLALYNALDYGAKGDGSTDDTAALQAALTAAAAVGGTLRIPAGTYSITGLTLTSKNYVTIVGDGKATKLVMRGSTDGAMTTFTMCNWITIRDIWFYGNNIGTTDGYSGSAIYYDLTGTVANQEGLIVTGCTFENFRGATWVRVQNPTNLDMSKVWILNNVALGGSDQAPATIGTASAQFGLRMAVGAGNINDVLIAGNHCEASTVKSGISSIGTGTGKFRRVMYVNNVVLNAGVTNSATVEAAYGLALYGTSEDCALLNNQSINSVACGIYTNLTRRVRIIGNTCTGTITGTPGTSDATLSRGGIAMTDPYEMVIANNTLDNNALCGIATTAGSSTLPIGVIAGNSITGGQFGIILRPSGSGSATPVGYNVTGNDIQGTTDFAILMRRVAGSELMSETNIVGNTITGCANGIGSTFPQTLRNVRVANNTVKVTGTLGIQIDSTAFTNDGTVVENNTVDGGTTYGLALSGGTWTQGRCVNNLVRNAGTNADTSKGCYRVTTAFVGELFGNVAYPVAGGSVFVATTMYPHRLSRAVTTTYTAVLGDDTLRADATGGAFTITFPLAASMPGKRITVIKIDAATNGAVTIGRSGADTLNNQTTFTIANRYQAITFESNGITAWNQIGSGIISTVGDVQVPNRITFPVTANAKILGGSTDLALRNTADTQNNLLLTDAGVGTFRASVSGVTETANDNSTKFASTAYVDRATTHTGTTSAAPTGTTSATAVMMGLAGSITPTRGTKIGVLITGQMSNNTINDGATVDARFGTGAAPTNGAAVTGTLVGIAQTFTALVAAQRDGFALSGKVTGLSVGTAYWLDVSLLAITGGTATVTGVSIVAWEIP